MSARPFTTVTVLVTANLRGAVETLPRLATLILRERRAATGLTLLLDLGDTCSAESWLCRVTQGRAPFLLLDAIGYDAAFIGGEDIPVPPDAFRRLRDRVVMPLFLWHRTSELTRREQLFAFAAGRAAPPPGTPAFRITRDAALLATEEAGTIVLGDVPAGHLRRVDICWPEWTITDARTIPLEATEPPEPTIAAVLDLVTEEAQFYAQQGEWHEPG
ncbi:MAG: hypothetical protein IT325_00025 [Anaerolineae bacterium]|nr:hypothetical protein [Anaerolineae bacterium]